MKTAVSTYLRPPNTPENPLVRLIRQSDGIQLYWKDGHTSFFHFVWLRDCCYCQECGDSYSSKRFFVPSDMPESPRTRDAVIDQDGSLVLVWEPDGHKSRFAPSWLRQHGYDNHSCESRQVRPAHWGSQQTDQLPRFALAAVNENDSVRMECYRMLRDFGMVMITDAPAKPGFVLEVAALCGPPGAGSAYGELFDLSPSSSVQTMGNTFRPVPPHTDEPFRYSPPGLITLGCIRPAKEGGKSVFVDGFHVGNQLRQQDPDAFDLLVHQPHSFHRRHDAIIDQEAKAPIFTLNENGRIAGIRFHTRASAPLEISAESLPAYYAAYRKLCQLIMTPENQIHIALQAGEAVILDNHRVLHSRTAFTDPQRHFQLCNISREDFHERLRLLAMKLNLHAEARQYPGAGVVTGY